MVYLVTEYVEPLQAHLEAGMKGDGNQRQLAIAWGLHQLMVLRRIARHQTLTTACWTAINFTLFAESPRIFG